MGTWGWDKISDRETLVGTVEAGTTEYYSVDHWCFHVRPDPAYARLLTNPDGKTNSNGTIECEVQPPGSIGGQDAESAATFEQYFGDLDGKRVVVTGSWVRDRGHTYDGKDIYDFTGGGAGKTEIHPVMSLLVEMGPSATGSTLYKFFVLSDDSGPTILGACCRSPASAASSAASCSAPRAR